MLQDEVKFIDIDIDQSTGQWFEFFGSSINQATGEIVYEKPSGVARVQMRSTAPFMEERLKKQKRKFDLALNPKTRQMERVPYFEEQPFEQLIAETDDMYDYAILALEGFRNKKTGKPIDCTRENKIALRRNEVFRRFFEYCQQVLHGSVEAIEKN